MNHDERTVVYSIDVLMCWAIYRDRETIIKNTLQIKIFTRIFVGVVLLKNKLTAGKNTYMVSPSYFIHIPAVNYPPRSHKTPYNGN